MNKPRRFHMFGDLDFRDGAFVVGNRPAMVAIDATPSDTPTVVMIGAGFLLSEDDRVVAIMGGILLEDLLRRCLEKHFPEKSESFIPSVFSRALQDLGARVQIARALGILPAELQKDADDIRDVRNKFAHLFEGQGEDKDSLSFEDSESIERYCGNMRAPKNPQKNYRMFALGWSSLAKLDDNTDEQVSISPDLGTNKGKFQYSLMRIVEHLFRFMAPEPFSPHGQPATQQDATQVTIRPTQAPQEPPNTE